MFHTVPFGWKILELSFNIFPKDGKVYFCVGIKLSKKNLLIEVHRLTIWKKYPISYLKYL